jgi:hypothetical protein
MKPLNLREYAEALALTDDREFALEILENLDFVDNANFDELCEDIAHASEDEFKKHDPRKQIERIGDRLNLLDEITSALADNGFSSGDPFRDPADEVRDLIDQHCKIEKMLEDARWLGTDKDIVEAVAQLLTEPTEFDL